MKAGGFLSTLSNYSLQFNLLSICSSILMEMTTSLKCFVESLCCNVSLQKLIKVANSLKINVFNMSSLNRCEFKCSKNKDGVCFLTWRILSGVGKAHNRDKICKKSSWEIFHSSVIDRRCIISYISLEVKRYFWIFSLQNLCSTTSLSRFLYVL